MRKIVLAAGAVTTLGFVAAANYDTGRSGERVVAEGPTHFTMATEVDRLDGYNVAMHGGLAPLDQISDIEYGEDGRIVSVSMLGEPPSATVPTS